MSERWVLTWAPHPWADETLGLERVEEFDNAADARRRRNELKGKPETAWTTLTGERLDGAPLRGSNLWA